MNSFPNFPSTAITVEMWVRTAQSGEFGLISYSIIDNEFLIYHKATDMDIYINTTPVTVPVTVNDGKWHHLAVTWKSADGSLKVYKDGVLAATTTLLTGASIASGGSLYLGEEQDGPGNLDPSQRLHGYYDEVRIWSIVRTASQIASRKDCELNGNETGLVLYYKMNETGSGSGITVLNSATSTGNILNATTTGPTVAFGINSKYTQPFNGVFSFNGTDQAAVTPSAVLSNASVFTIEFWVNTLQSGSTANYWTNPTLIGNENGNAPDNDFGITTQNGFLSIWSGLNDGCCDNFISAAVPINDGTWHHVAAVNDGSTINLFLDGINVAAILSSNKPLITSGFPLAIAASNSQGLGGLAWYHQGMIDEVRISNNVRYISNFTPSSVPFHADANVVALYHMDGCNNGLSEDASFNGNHASLVGFPSCAPSIAVGAVATSVCQGLHVSVPFTATGTFNAGNVFTAQLSDASGNFNVPVNIGALSSTSSGVISATIPKTTPAGTGYRVRVISSNPPITGFKNTVAITVNELPDAKIKVTGSLTFCQGDSVQLKASVKTGVTYQWTLNNVTIAGATNQTYIAKVAGSYRVKVTSAALCMNTSKAKVVTINCKNSLADDASLELTAEASPNPSSSQFMITCKSGAAGPVSLNVYDMAGRLCNANRLIFPGEQTLLGAELAPGVYMAKLRQGNNLITLKLVKVME